MWPNASDRCWKAVTGLILQELFDGLKYSAIWRLVNAGFAIRIDGTYLFIDPVLNLPIPLYTSNSKEYINGKPLPSSMKAYDPQEVEVQPDDFPLRAADIRRADVVLLSHDHEDHFDRSTIRDIAHLEPTVIAPKYCRDELVRCGLPDRKIEAAEYGRSFSFTDLSVEIIYAEHKKPGDCGFLIKSRYGNIYYPGDSRFDHSHKAEIHGLSVDYLLLPINDTNFGAGMAALLTQILQPRAVIPCHYGFVFPPVRSQGGHPAEYLAALASRSYRIPNTDIMILKPGGKIVLT